MDDYEKLGVFYLGREYDLSQKKLQDGLLLYDSKDLVTHAVCVGMTGSGKTGLCLDLIEEAAIDGIPAILIDPKGDLCDLLLTFPELRPEDFLPWVNPDDARQKGISVQDYARSQAELWKKGLADWGQSPERIQRLREAADFAIYTPGSSAGLPVSILKSFSAPDATFLADRELLRDRVTTLVDSLLALAGIDADPLQSREHILLSTLVESAWRQGQDLDLAVLIGQVQNPPITRIGVLELESFYPAKERFALVMALNNLLASPGFSSWLEGEPLDITQMLYTPQGKPRVAIFSIAHLGDSERMFFVSLLLNAVLGWMHSQPGTNSLRAILYMDEIFGYLPPVGNPPSKLPLLTLLKQARAFGVGVVLATQNPVDLDYKGLSNAGTWFIGRLQTERDKARLLDGLEGASAAAGVQFDRREIETIISSLGSRVFLMNNTHEDVPVVFQTRWALSYLRGPLTREQIKRLMEGTRPQSTDGGQPRVAGKEELVSPVASPSPTIAQASPLAPSMVSAPATQSPTLPPDIQRFYVPLRGRLPAGCTLVYQPQLFGAARVSYTDAKTGLAFSQSCAFLTPIIDSPVPVDWEAAQEAGFATADLEKDSQPGGSFANLPALAGQAKSYTAWNRAFVNWLYGSQTLELLRSPSLKQVSKPGESDRDFRIRLAQAAREQRDEAVEALRKKYAPKLAALQERLRKAEQAKEREAAQAREAGFQTAISFGATLLSAFTGRKVASRSSLGRATTAMRGVSRTMSAKQDIDRAGETVEAIQAQIKQLQEEFDQETAALQSKIDPLTETLESVTYKPKKTDIAVQLVALVWVPFFQEASGGFTPAW